MAKKVVCIETGNHFMVTEVLQPQWVLRPPRSSSIYRLEPQRPMFVIDDMGGNFAGVISSEDCEVIDD